MSRSYRLDTTLGDAVSSGAVPASLGEVIAAGMVRHGIPNYARLAERVGVSGATVSRWVNGVSIPDRNTLLKLAEVLGTKASVVEEAAGLTPEPSHDVETIHPLAAELDGMLQPEESYLTGTERETLEMLADAVIDRYRRVPAARRRDVLQARRARQRKTG